MSDTEKNGNGNKVFWAVVSAVCVTIGTAWATSSTKTADRVQALEISRARSEAEVDTLKRDIKEIKETLGKIWNRMDRGGRPEERER